jgi:hypothetical protein
MFFIDYGVTAQNSKKQHIIIDSVQPLLISNEEHVFLSIFKLFFFFTLKLGIAC